MSASLFVNAPKNPFGVLSFQTVVLPLGSENAKALIPIVADSALRLEGCPLTLGSVKPRQRTTVGVRHSERSRRIPENVPEARQLTRKS
jgi:hypothetical protein